MTSTLNKVLLLLLLLLLIIIIILIIINNYSQKNCSCFEYRVLRSILFSVKTAEQLKLVENKQSGFFVVSKFYY